MHDPTRRRLSHLPWGRWWPAAAALVIVAATAGRTVGQPATPGGCERVAEFYESHEVARDFFPCGFYGGAGVHPMLGMPPAIAAEIGLERLSAYGVNVVITGFDVARRAGEPAAFGDLSRLLYGTLLPRYEIKALPTLANQGFRFSAEPFAGMQRDRPLLSVAEMAAAEEKLAEKLAFAADVATRYPDTILGFISDDEPHFMAPSVAAAQLIEKHTGRFATFPMPTYDHVAAFSEHVQPLAADWYVCTDTGRDSWCIATRMRTIARQWPGRMIWFVPLAISFTGGHEATLPNMPDSRTTRTELRLQCWSALALGAKGVLFYNPGGWAFTWGGNEDPLFDVMGRPNAPHPRQDNLAEIRSLAADFTTIGPSLVTACPIVDAGVRIDCQGVRYPTFSGPAIDCGTLRDAATGRDFIVPWNNDVDHEQTGTLTLPADMLAGGRRLYDLHDLEPVHGPADGRVEVSLPPGGGRIYLLGDAASFAAVRDSILRHRVRSDRVRARVLAHRLRTKAGSRLRADAFDHVDACIGRAQAAEESSAWPQATTAYREAIAELETLLASLPTAATEAVLDKAGGIIAAADDLMRTHDGRLYDIGPMTDTARMSDAKLPVQAEQRAWIALVKRYLDLEYTLFTGASGADRAAADSLLRNAADYRTALWRKFSRRLTERRAPLRVALVTPDRDGLEETLAYAWAYGQCEACWIAPDERGVLVDTDGRPFEPADYDAVWVHQLRYAQPPAANSIDPSLVLMPALMEPAMLRSLHDYVADGGGLLLTGIAGLYTLPLGLERVAPDRIRENSYLTRDLSVGIVPAPGAERHPVLAHVPAAGHLTNGGPRGQTVVTECVWDKLRPSGTVLAHELDGQYGRLKDVAAIVQYTLGKGTVLVLGGIGCDLTPGGLAEGDGRSRARRTTLDALAYVAGGRQQGVRDAADAVADTNVAARPLGKRDARPTVGPTWMQNARARVEILTNNAGLAPQFRYMRWDANKDAWRPFVDRVFVGSHVLDPAARADVQKKYNVDGTFDGVSLSRVLPAVTDGSASLRFRLERPDLWAEYRLTLLKDSPFLLVEQSGQSGPEMAGGATVVLAAPMEFGVAGTGDNPAEIVEHLARDHRDEGWLLRMKRSFAAATSGDSQICAILPASAAPAPQVFLMTPGIKQISQVSMPFFFIGHVGPAADGTAALQQWVNEQLPLLEPYRVPPPKR